MRTEAPGLITESFGKKKVGPWVPVVATYMKSPETSTGALAAFVRTTYSSASVVATFPSKLMAVIETPVVAKFVAAGADFVGAEAAAAVVAAEIVIEDDEKSSTWEGRLDAIDTDDSCFEADIISCGGGGATVKAFEADTSNRRLAALIKESMLPIDLF